MHLHYTLDREGTKKQRPRNSSTKKSPCQTVTMKKNSMPGEGMLKNIYMSIGGYKKNSAAKGINILLVKLSCITLSPLFHFLCRCDFFKQISSLSTTIIFFTSFVSDTLDFNTASVIKTSLVHSKLHLCNYFYPILPQKQLSHLQLLQNSSNN